MQLNKITIIIAEINRGLGIVLYIIINNITLF